MFMVTIILGISPIELSKLWYFLQNEHEDIRLMLPSYTVCLILNNLLIYVKLAAPKLDDS